MDRIEPTLTHRRRTKALALGALAILAALPGCSEPGPFLRRQSMIGALKTDVAKLGSDNSQLRKEVADLKTENRRMENQLAEVESQNGDLTARLDDARAVIGRQGLDTSEFNVPARSATDTNRRSQPVRQQKGRKTPMAEIPRDRRSLSDDDNIDESIPAPPPDDPNGSQSRLDDRSPWLPVARGALNSKSRVR